MRYLWAMIFKQVLSLFILTLAICSLVFMLVDLFVNLLFFLYGAGDMLPFVISNIPRSVSYALLPAMLFSVAFSFGSLFANNELIAILGGGISLMRFAMPVMLFALLLGIGDYVFYEKVVLPANAEHARFVAEIKPGSEDLSKSMVNADASVVIFASRIDREVMINPIVVIRKADRPFDCVSASTAEKIDGMWTLKDATLYALDRSPSVGDAGDKHLTLSTQAVFTDTLLKASEFGASEKSSEFMTHRDLGRYMDDLSDKTSHFYRIALTDWYVRYLRILLPLLVAWFSAFAGSRWKNNVLLKSLIAGLGVSIGYTLLQEFFVQMAKDGYLPPLLGASLGAIIMLAFAIIMSRRAQS